MYKDIYMFPAIVTKFDEDDYNVTFPDFEEIITCGEDLEEAYTMAEDALKLCLFDLYEDDEDINASTKLENIQQLEDNQTIIMVRVNLKEVIKEYDNRAVKKTLTIPSWLNKEADKAHINYSHILQEALKEHLSRMG